MCACVHTCVLLKAKRQGWWRAAVVQVQTQVALAVVDLVNVHPWTPWTRDVTAAPGGRQRCPEAVTANSGTSQGPGRRGRVFETGNAANLKLLGSSDCPAAVGSGSLSARPAGPQQRNPSLSCRASLSRQGKRQSHLSQGLGPDSTVRRQWSGFIIWVPIVLAL